MTPQQIRLVQHTWEQIRPNAGAVGETFYSRLFERDPSLRKLFRSDVQAQSRKLVNAVTLATQSLASLERLTPVLHELGRRHASYGVEDRHYSTVGAALLETLEAALADSFTPAARQAWTATYEVLAETMRRGAAEGSPIDLQAESFDNQG